MKNKGCQKNLLERKRHKKAELPEKLESIPLKSGFNQEIWVQISHRSTTS